MKAEEITKCSTDNRFDKSLAEEIILYKETMLDRQPLIRFGTTFLTTSIMITAEFYTCVFTQLIRMFGFQDKKQNLK